MSYTLNNFLFRKCNDDKEPELPEENGEKSDEQENQAACLKTEENADEDENCEADAKNALPNYLELITGDEESTDNTVKDSTQNDK